ncbi:hypothetical protein TRFO_29062 [Tritrichomonas foetus]|uniref:Sec16 Sec23-binding domain-containing protein n=1 Tax=Tritrichomonas foetus TaxID=1144522 RepID=A0A1J4JX39_9EUKA|nr:hypothetical protein TRFO_29062 [Tritrichomonas foetus]|eukprot:OHT03563.1 hypothetical protein TRFO_29062 [Tritrichomonas foetus]
MFGNSESQNDSSSLFGAPPENNNEAASLFGSPQEEENVSSLFGNSENNDEAASLFGNQTNQQDEASSLFGSQPNQQDSSTTNSTGQQQQYPGAFQQTIQQPVQNNIPSNVFIPNPALQNTPPPCMPAFQQQQQQQVHQNVPYIPGSMNQQQQQQPQQRQPSVYIPTMNQQQPNAPPPLPSTTTSYPNMISPPPAANIYNTSIPPTPYIPGLPNTQQSQPQQSQIYIPGMQQQQQQSPQQAFIPSPQQQQQNPPPPPAVSPGYIPGMNQQQQNTSPTPTPYIPGMNQQQQQQNSPVVSTPYIPGMNQQQQQSQGQTSPHLSTFMPKPPSQDSQPQIAPPPAPGAFSSPPPVPQIGSSIPTPTSNQPPPYIPGLGMMQQQQQATTETVLTPNVFTPMISKEFQQSTKPPPPPPAATFSAPPPIPQPQPTPNMPVNMPKFQVPQEPPPAAKPKVTVFMPGGSQGGESPQNTPPSSQHQPGQPSAMPGFQMPPAIPGFKAPPAMPGINPSPASTPPNTAPSTPPSSQNGPKINQSPPQLQPFKPPPSMPKFIQPVPVPQQATTDNEKENEPVKSPATVTPNVSEMPSSPFKAPPAMSSFAMPKFQQPVPAPTTGTSSEQEATASEKKPNMPAMPSFAMPSMPTMGTDIQDMPTMGRDMLDNETETSNQTQDNRNGAFGFTDDFNNNEDNNDNAHNTNNIENTYNHDTNGEKIENQVPSQVPIQTSTPKISSSPFKPPPAMPKFAPPPAMPSFQQPVPVPSTNMNSPSDMQAQYLSPNTPKFAPPVGIPTSGSHFVGPPPMMMPSTPNRSSSAIPRSQTSESISSNPMVVSNPSIIAPPEIPRFTHSVSQPCDVVHSSIPFFTKRKPITAFGFGGIFIRATNSVSSSPGSQSGSSNQENTVEICKINKVCKSSVIDQLGNFQRGTTPAEIHSFINKRISSCESAEDALLWAAVHIRVQHGSSINVTLFNQNAKLMGTPEYSLLQMLSNKNPTISSTSANYIPSDIDPKLVDALQKVMIDSGEREGLEFTIKNRMWPFAFLIAQSLSISDQKRVAQEFISQSIGPSPLFNILSAISGQQRDLREETWQEMLATTLRHYTPSAVRSLQSMAAFLETNNHLQAAHVCRILASQQITSPPDSFALVGTDWKHPTITSVQMSQVICSDAMTVNFYPFAMYYTMALIDYGFTDLARSNNQRLKGRFKRENSSPFFVVAKTIHRRLKMAIARNFQGGLVKNFMSVVDKALTTLVHGEEEPDVDEYHHTKLPEQIKLRKEGDDDDINEGNDNMSQEHENNKNITKSVSNNDLENEGNKGVVMSKVPTKSPSINDDFGMFGMGGLDSYDPISLLAQNSNESDTKLQQSIPFSPVKPKQQPEQINNQSHSWTSAPKRQEPTPASPQQKPQPESVKPRQDASNKNHESHNSGGGWLSGLLSKINPFTSGTSVDLSMHDEGEMVWNGKKYVLKGHENDEDEKPPPPPPPPMAVSVPPPQEPSGSLGGPPPPGSGDGPKPLGIGNAGPPPPAAGSIRKGGRTRASNRYVTEF